MEGCEDAESGYRWATAAWKASASKAEQAKRSKAKQDVRFHLGQPPSCGRQSERELKATAAKAHSPHRVPDVEGCEDADSGYRLGNGRVGASTLGKHPAAVDRASERAQSHRRKAATTP